MRFNGRLKRIEKMIMPKLHHGRTVEEIEAIRADVQLMISDPECGRLAALLWDRCGADLDPWDDDPHVLALVERVECLRDSQDD